MLVVIGGGGFGCYHAGQLLKAVRAGRLAGERLVIVDRDPACPAGRRHAGDPEVSLVGADWSEFLSRWLPGAAPTDHVIPAPLAPHLLWRWLATLLGRAFGSPPRGWRLPYEQPGPGGELYLSAAAWRCPATCIEPAHCPALHAPRDWDLAGIIEDRARELGCEPAVFRVLHLAGGVGSVRVADLLEAGRRLAAAPRAPVLVATSSRCHAAVGVLRPRTRRVDS